MTVVIVLKPNFGGTVRRSIQRVTGTVPGALLAAFIMLDLPEPWLLWAVLPVFAFSTFASRNYNYTLFSFSLTAMVLLMLDIAHPITPAASFLRVLHTIIGSILALSAGYLLFPTWESRQLPNRIAEALKKEALLVRALRDAMLGIKRRPIADGSCMRWPRSRIIRPGKRASSNLMPSPIYFLPSLKPGKSSRTAWNPGRRRRDSRS